MFEVVKTGLRAPAVPASGTVRAGDMVYCVVIPRDQATGEITEGGIEPQMRQTLENLAQAIEATGGSLADVVQVMIYLAYRDDFAGMNAVYAEFFTAPFPTRATFVTGLLDPRMRVEIVAHANLWKPGAGAHPAQAAG
jgi:enamine deaminase RidA (YjgF/YER057c/UK114 family)